MLNDIDNAFLMDFAQDVIFTAEGVPTTIRAHLFEEPLDKLGVQYSHAWCKYSDIPDVKKGDTLEINSILYGIVDFSPDEFQTGMNLFLSEV